MKHETTIAYKFSGKEVWGLEANLGREWALTNGIGGYAGSSITGAHSRYQHGYLIASLRPPVERYLVFSKINETITQGGNVFSLETAKHLNKDTDGTRYLEEFLYDGTVQYTYEPGAVTMVKGISLVQGENTAAISYEVTNDSSADASLTLTPLMNYRVHGEASTCESLRFTVLEGAHAFALIPEANPDIAITLVCSEGQLLPRKQVYDVNMLLQTEIDKEEKGLDCNYTPYDIRIVLPAHSTVRFSVLCTVGAAEDSLTDTNGLPSSVRIDSDTAFQIIDAERARLRAYIDHAGYTDPLARKLTLASMQFLAFRQSTNLTTILAGLPWFTDWGRDTMIAFTGVTLATKRYHEAGEILLSFAQYIRHGLVPNMFPDSGQEPLYNTVDASLWYIYAVYEYLQYTKTSEGYDFVRDYIFPKMMEIIDAYRHGTMYSIHMDRDGLISAGSGLDQVTWMDVRVGDWVATPRHGKPVEINALWYNALRIMERLCHYYTQEAKANTDPDAAFSDNVGTGQRYNPKTLAYATLGNDYAGLAERVKSSFRKKFWNEQKQCLYDVVDADKDDTLRPNQIYAVSLPFTMLDPDQEWAIVETVHRELYAQTGLRTLPRRHPDYHPTYEGSLAKRDPAYHQGTSWAFLLGGFISAFMKVHGHSRQSAHAARQLLAPVIEHLNFDGCIGSISEIFDGDAPHTCRGCYAQAWSVGEILRCYTQDILPYL